MIPILIKIIGYVITPKCFLKTKNNLFRDFSPNSSILEKSNFISHGINDIIPLV